MTQRDLPDAIAVLGAGTMGAGTAALFALHGARVTLVVRRSAGPQVRRSAGPQVRRSAGPRVRRCRSRRACA